jgi:hypothetical protein
MNNVQPTAGERRQGRQSIDVTGLPAETVRALESLVSALRSQAAASPPSGATPDEWAQLFDAWMREVAARAGMYPPGFVVDDSRESIYEGRGEGEPS